MPRGIDNGQVMTRIDPSTNLIARIRAQLGSVAPLRNLRSRAPGTSPPSDPQSLRDLTSTVVSRVGSIASDDPHRERKALRIFLEAVLLGELGTELAGDPRFQDMLDHVQDQFDSDPELARAASEAASHLLGETHKG
jgi:hypothetical protein